jgi:hypothetical protein
MTVFWDVTRCSEVCVTRRFGRTYSNLKMGEACYSKTLVTIYQTVRRDIPEDNNNRSDGLAL